MVHLRRNTLGDEAEGREYSKREWANRQIGDLVRKTSARLDLKTAQAATI
jgi:hypothetical protein